MLQCKTLVSDVLSPTVSIKFGTIDFGHVGYAMGFFFAHVAIGKARLISG